MTERHSSSSGLSRRDMLTAIRSGALGLAGAGILGRTAFATPEDAAKAIGEVTGGKTPQEGLVSLDLPQIAENGNTVPITVSVDSPMTADNYVKAVHVYAEGNPTPNVATFQFSPMSGKAEVSVRMRLAKTQNVVAVAETSGGEFHMTKKEIKVTIGGCGG